ncbi:MAG: VOC family protein [Acidimicrobiia bacterium]|nr:VOC family protein [Acidimicrobiia bacterium]
MSTRIGNVALWVSDLDRSERFWTEGLGLDVQARIDTPDVREVLVGSPEGGSQVLLSKATMATEENRPRPDGIWKVFLDVDDVHAAFDRALAAGATPDHEPFVLELPTLTITLAFVRDPDGYLIEMGRRV